MADVILPLGVGSKHSNEELRMLLRSVDKNLKGVERVFLVTTCCPDWVNRENVIVVPIADKYDNNKDANLHLKTLSAIERYNIGDFVWLSDDNAILREIGVNEIPILHNHRDNQQFLNNAGSKWRARVANTLRFAFARGANIQHNYECHCPQLFNGQMLLEGMKGVDYASLPGLTIFTTWRVVTNTWQGSKSQLDWKETYEMPCTPKDVILDKSFVGYNDSAFQGVLARLKQLFPNKSRFEK